MIPHSPGLEFSQTFSRRCRNSNLLHPARGFATKKAQGKTGSIGGRMRHPDDSALARLGIERRLSGFFQHSTRIIHHLYTTEQTRAGFSHLAVITHKPHEHRIRIRIDSGRQGPSVQVQPLAPNTGDPGNGWPGVFCRILQHWVAATRLAQYSQTSAIRQAHADRLTEAQPRQQNHGKTKHATQVKIERQGISGTGHRHIELPPKRGMQLRGWQG